MKFSYQSTQNEGNVAYMEEKVSAYRVLEGKCEERDHLEDLAVDGRCVNWQIHVCVSLGETPRCDGDTQSKDMKAVGSQRNFMLYYYINRNILL